MSPKSTLYVSLLCFSTLTLTVATVSLPHSATLFLFPLLTFTPKSVAVYRHSISVTPVDKRNFSSHLHADCYFRGSWQTQKSQSPSCQWDSSPHLTNCLCPPLPPFSLPLSLSPLSLSHTASKHVENKLSKQCFVFKLQHSCEVNINPFCAHFQTWNYPLKKLYKIKENNYRSMSSIPLPLRRIFI